MMRKIFDRDKRILIAPEGGRLRKNHPGHPGAAAFSDLHAEMNGGWSRPRYLRGPPFQRQLRWRMFSDGECHFRSKAKAASTSRPFKGRNFRLSQNCPRSDM